MLSFASANSLPTESLLTLANYLTTVAPPSMLGRLGSRPTDFGTGVVDIIALQLFADDGMFHNVCNMNLPTTNDIKPSLLPLA